MRAPEEILIFTAPARMGRRALVAIFAVFIFVEGDLSVKIVKFCTT